MERVRIREAGFPEELPLVRQLFREYEADIKIDLCFQSFAEELAGLPGRYAPPTGGLWIAELDQQVAGCVALRGLSDASCEIKRLYVRPAARGAGVGRRLAERVLAAAADAGYRRVCLDTLPSMGAAVALYRSLGFVDIAPYYANPVRGALFLGREL